MCSHFDVLVKSPNTQHSELPELPTAGRIMFVSKQNFFPIKILSILSIYSFKNEKSNWEIRGTLSGRCFDDNYVVSCSMVSSW